MWRSALFLTASILASSDEAVACVGTPLTGLDPTGTSDNTTLIQGAINSASAAGGGNVVINPGKYKMTGSLDLKRGVVLCGATQGPFDFSGPDVLATAASFLITNTAAPFITISGTSTAVTDFMFHYPNQSQPTAASPVPYPATIVVLQPGAKIERCTVTNAWIFLDIQVGRTVARDLNIGAFQFGIYVDHAADRVALSDIVHSVFWDMAAGLSYPQPIDTWVLNNGYAFVLMRVDSVQIHNVLVFNRYAGFYLTDSPDPALPQKMGYGMASNIDIDICKYGIIARSTNGAAYLFNNLDLGCGSAGVWGITHEAGGSAPPQLLVVGGIVRPPWSGGQFQAFPSPSKLVVRHMLGYDE